MKELTSLVRPKVRIIANSEDGDERLSALLELAGDMIEHKIQGISVAFAVQMVIFDARYRGEDQLANIYQTVLDLIQEKSALPIFKTPKDFIRKEVLDLSNHSTKEDECLDLAKHLSAVMLNKNTPASVYNALAHELTDQNVPEETYYSPENLAKILCKENQDE